MRDLFVEDGTDAARTQLSPDAAQEIRDAMAGRHVCPFCGAVREQSDGICARCTMDNTSASRQATKARIGPWYVFQSRNPAAPGMKFDTLLGFIRKGRVKARSVVRGPTTHQLWRFAAHVKGISREFGICYSCGGAIERSAGVCPHCNRLQEPPADPDVFIEGRQHAAPDAAQSPPLVRETSPAPLAAGSDADALPAVSLSALRPAVARPSKPAEPGSPADEAAKQRAADGFLSPQDLAAAFNLDFRPKGRKFRAQQKAAAAARRASPPRRPRRWGRALLVLALLGAAGGGVYAFATKPQLRVQAVQWSSQAADWTKQSWAQLRQAVAAASSSHAAHTGSSIPVGQSAPPSVIPPAPPAAVTPWPEVKTEAAAPIPAKSPEPQVPSSPSPPSPPSPWDKLYHQPTAPDAKAAVTDSGPPTDGAPASVSPAIPQRTGTLDDVRKLYRDAISAEGDNDFATAVKKYEQIKQFSPTLWPADLNLRLSQARQQVQ